jgi:Flp pilus assembly protein TadD
MGQRQNLTQSDMQAVPLALRCATALTSLVAYLGQTFWPINLVAFHLYPAAIPLWQTLTAAGVLGGITALVLWQWRRPWLAVGWLWFAGTLVPVSGIMVVGEHGLADRYTCVPHIGLFLLVVWESAEWLTSWRWPVEARTALAVAVLGVLAVLTWLQVGVWQNPYTLWNSAVARDPDNYRAHAARGRVLLHQGKAGAALGEFREAHRLRDSARTNYDLGVALLKQSDPKVLEESANRFRRALELRPEYADALAGLGEVRLRQGKGPEAVGHLSAALRHQSGATDLQALLGAALLQSGRPGAARSELQKALQVNPDSAETLHNMGLSYAREGLWDEAVTWYRRAQRCQPDNPAFRLDRALALWKKGALEEARAEDTALKHRPDWRGRFLIEAWRLATAADPVQRDPARALELATQANQDTQPEAGALDVLAAAQASAGRYAEAAATARQAVELAPEERKAEMRERLQAYEQDRPWRR